MDRKPFLTIGIASYNYGKYLLKAFEQIHKQSFRDFELLYCDDGSTDDSVEVIESIIRNHPDMNIQLIKGENKGLLENKNRIIQHAKGRYLLICDADDYMTDDCLEKLCHAAKKEDADCVIGGFCETDGKGKIYKIHVPTQDSNPWIYIWHHAQIYKMELIRTHDIEFSIIPDDVCFLQKVHLYADKITFVSDSLYYWVRHSDSTSRDFDENEEWHPNSLWHNIVDCMMGIQRELTTEDDKWQICYFLLKWFYLNVADLPIADRKQLRHNIKAIQEDMKRVCPNYRKWSAIRLAFKEKDSLFAKTAIFICWVVEGVGCIKLLPMFRSAQQRMR